ncbi:MAG: pantoate--beta-alanine ligase [Desulfovibrio sp.]|jgi:pantoate--beta-alanine ligase|nr:pantoate--beta-alanine ligase [Desulfovibrio sp.]
MKPQVMSDPESVRDTVRGWKKQGLSIGLVPTMGFLHEGHASLIRRAREDNERVAVSIFVNPKQFSPSEDLDNYPRDMEHDLEVCRSEGADLVFKPEPGQMYPNGFQTIVAVDKLASGLCGASRPGHFTGVCTVVCKLFNIIHPDRAYFGRKDAQQLAVITRMTRDLNMNVEIVGCPIVREPDGLAKSSRNSYLDAKERGAALCLRKALLLAEEAVAGGTADAAQIRAVARKTLEAEPLARIDYIAVVDPDSLEEAQGEIGKKALVALAVFIGRTRLIDNTLIGR